MNRLKLCSVISLTLIMAACQQDNSYQYLVTHPSVLAKRYEECKSAENLNKFPTQECSVVFNAFTAFMMVQEEAMSDPQKLGQRILDAEAEYVKLQENYQQAKDVLTGLQRKTNDATAMQEAKDNVARAEQAVKNKKDEIDLLMAVVGQNSPE